VRDVGERAAVHQARLALQRLDEVGLDRVLEQHGHRARGLKVFGSDGLGAVVAVRDGDRAQAAAQVLQIAGHCEDGHDLGRGGDVESGLARIAVGAAAEADGHLPERAVVHVHRAAPADAQCVDRMRVAVQDRGVDHRREEVVGRADGVDVTGEVQVEVLHRDDLGQPAAGGAALDPEHRAQRRLAQAQHRTAADVPEALRQADGGGRLALARLRRRHPRHADQLAVRQAVQPVEHRERDLRLVAAVGLDLAGIQPGLLGDRLDRLEHRLLRDLQARLHVASSIRMGQWLTAAAASSDTSWSV
jgi:hypothetical protein